MIASDRVNDADVSRLIDEIAAEEARLRKARVLALVHARAVLTVRQQKQVERIR